MRTKSVEARASLGEMRLMMAVGSAVVVGIRPVQESGRDLLNERDSRLDLYTVEVTRVVGSVYDVLKHSLSDSRSLVAFALIMSLTTLQSRRSGITSRATRFSKCNLNISEPAWIHRQS